MVHVPKVLLFVCGGSAVEVGVGSEHIDLVGLTIGGFQRPIREQLLVFVLFLLVLLF